MWELDHKEGRKPKNRCLCIVVLEKTLESPLDCKKIKSGNPKENQPWIFIGRTDAEYEAPKLWPADVKSRLIGKDPDAEKNWRQKEKRVTENKMIGWNHQYNGHELGKLQELMRDRMAWLPAVHRVAKSQMWFVDWTITTTFNNFNSNISL